MVPRSSGTSPRLAKAIPILVALAVFAASLALSMHVYRYTDVKADVGRYLPRCPPVRGVWISMEDYEKYCAGNVTPPLPYTDFMPALPAGGTYIAYIASVALRNRVAAEWATSSLFAAAAAALAARMYREEVSRGRIRYLPATLGLATVGGYSSDPVGALLLASRTPELASFSIVFSYLCMPLLVLRMLVDDPRNLPRYLPGFVAVLALMRNPITSPYNLLFRYWVHPCEFCVWEIITFKVPWAPLATLFACIAYSVAIVARFLGARSARAMIPFLGASVPPQVMPVVFVALRRIELGRGFAVSSIIADACNAGVVALLMSVRNPFALTTPTYALGFARDALYLVPLLRAALRELRATLLGYEPEQGAGSQRR